MEAIGLIKILSKSKFEENEIIIVCDNKAIIDNLNNENKLKNERLKGKMVNMRRLITNENMIAIHCNFEECDRIRLCDSLCNFTKKLSKNNTKENVIYNIREYLEHSNRYKKFKNYKIEIV